MITERTSLPVISEWATAGNVVPITRTVWQPPQVATPNSLQIANPIISPTATATALTLEHYPEWPIWMEGGMPPWWWESGAMPEEDNGPPAASSTPSLPLQWSISGTIKNIFAEGYWQEAPASDTIALSAVQASALVFQGPQQFGSNTAKNTLTITSKPLEADIFGSRMRIIGKLQVGEDKNLQQPLNAFDIITTVTSDAATEYSEKTISGGSAGITFFYDPDDDSGYFFEIVALPSVDITLYTDINVWGLQNQGNLGSVAPGVYNILFYKQGADKVARPLWMGLGNIICNSGSFVGLSRMANTDNVSVYDLAVETIRLSNGIQFKLYMNGKLIANVTDSGTILQGPNAGMYVRGSTLAMFENLYGVKQQAGIAVSNDNNPIDNIVSPTKRNAIEYQLPPFVSMALSGVSTQTYPDFTLDYEEFGTILRECAYINAKYNAYPALWAKLAPVLVREKAYVPSRLYATPFSAEFMVFNVMDSAVVLNAESGNYLRLLGVTLTQESSKEFSVEKMLKENNANANWLNDIYASIIKYGQSEFSMESMYLQNKQMAKRVLEWILARRQQQKNQIALRIFGNPALQIGDTLHINYADTAATIIDGVYAISSIAYSRRYNDFGMDITAVEI